MKKNNEKINLLDLVPERVCKWEKNSDSNVSLIVPRFKNHFLRKIAGKFGKSEEVKIHLDEKGSSAWQLIDGKMDVETIGKHLQREDNESLQQFYERLSKYLIILLKNKFISFKMNT